MSKQESIDEEKLKEFNRKCCELAENIEDLCNLYPRGVSAVALLSAAGFATADMDREFSLIVFDSARKTAQESD